jgi:hypothetical protein
MSVRLKLQVSILLFVGGLVLMPRVAVMGQTNEPQERIIKKLSWPKEPVKIKAIKSKVSEPWRKRLLARLSGCVLQWPLAIADDYWKWRAAVSPSTVFASSQIL